MTIRLSAWIQVSRARVISLDLLGDLVARGGLESVFKVRASFGCFEAAMRQMNAEIALILNVRDGSFASPDTCWRKEQLVIDLFGGG
jgi:hypothetical protein